MYTHLSMGTWFFLFAFRLRLAAANWDTMAAMIDYHDEMILLPPRLIVDPRCYQRGPFFYYVWNAGRSPFLYVFFLLIFGIQHLKSEWWRHWRGKVAVHNSPTSDKRFLVGLQIEGPISYIIVIGVGSHYHLVTRKKVLWKCDKGNNVATFCYHNGPAILYFYLPIRKNSQWAEKNILQKRCILLATEIGSWQPISWMSFWI